DVPFPGVVRGDRLLLVAAKTVGEVAEVLGSRLKVLRRIGEIVRTQPAPRSRRELHQPDGAAGRPRRRHVTRLSVDDSSDQLRRQIVLSCLTVDDAAEGNLLQEELLSELIRGGHNLAGRIRDPGWRGRHGRRYVLDGSGNTAG